MKRLCLPLLHPLAEVFFAAVRSVTTSMSDSTKGRYRTTTDTFFAIWGEHHPGVRTLDELRRDPHILGWLTWLSSQQPPLVKSTRFLCEPAQREDMIGGLSPPPGFLVP